MKTIDVRLTAYSFSGKDHQGEKADENAQQRTRNSEPERNVPV